MKFTYEGYRGLIKALKDNEYSICDYHNYATCLNRNVAILRHDVDMSVEKALKIAEVEKELDVKSTFFFLVSSDFYNIASKKNTTIISEIVDLGHEIGLHFDEVKYEGTTYDPHRVIERIKKEKQVMEDITGSDIKTVSMHRPSKMTLDSNLVIDDMVNSYSDVFFKEFKYVSDSRHMWRDDPHEAINDKSYAKLHILTHPIWYNDEEESLKTTLRKFIESASCDRKNTLFDNIRDLNEILGEEEK